MFDLPKISGPRRNVPGVAAKGIVQGAKAEKNTSNRSNLIALLLVLSYIGVSILVFHFVEHWSIVDCVYYAMVIVTTVGYGDVIPVTTAGKAFTIFFAFYGICTIGIALGQLASVFLERQKSVAKQATKTLLRTVDDAATTTAAAKEAELGINVSAKTRKLKKSRRLNKPLPKWVRVVFSESNKAIVQSLIPIFVSIGAGLIVGGIEGWPALDCFYYSIITVTTVGFGDLSPKSEGARIFAIFFLPLSVVSVAHGVGSVLEEISKRKVLKTKISMKELLDMDANGDGKVSQLEYLSYMLVKLNKADQDDIDGILAQFRKLDRDGSGELDRDDLERLDKQLQEQEAAEQQ